MKDEFLKKLMNSCQLLKDNESYLGQLDSKFGDGDHGVTIAKIANNIENTVNENKEKTLKEIFVIISNNILNMGAGSASSLWGMIFLGFSEAVDNNIDSETIKNMFIKSYEKLRIISQAEIGDKTLMDAFLPGYNKALAGSSFDEIVQAMKDGANKTSEYAAKYGRAKNYKEQSIGTCDPGAISLSILFEGLK